jgi:nucleoside phosphorylase
VVTIVDEEQQAVRELFGTMNNIVGSPYMVRENPTGRHFDLVTYQIADRTTNPATRDIAQLIEELHPDYIIVAGIAGGFESQGIAVGDVVIGETVVGYEFVKLDQGNIRPRLVAIDHPAKYLRHSIANPIHQDGLWTESIRAERPDGQGKPKAHFGMIVSGDKLMGDPSSEMQKALIGNFDKALAVDQETYGVATCLFGARAQPDYNPLYLPVRGISDLVGHAENDQMRQRWRPYAAAAAAAFAKHVCDRLLQVPDPRLEGYR